MMNVTLMLLQARKMFYCCCRLEECCANAVADMMNVALMLLQE